MNTTDSPTQHQWTNINLADSSTLPTTPVLCITQDNHYQVLELVRYGNDIERWAWETRGLKPNKAFPVDFVTKWINTPSVK